LPPILYRPPCEVARRGDPASIKNSGAPGIRALLPRSSRSKPAASERWCLSSVGSECGIAERQNTWGDEDGGAEIGGWTHPRSRAGERHGADKAAEAGSCGLQESSYARRQTCTVNRRGTGTCRCLRGVTLPTSEPLRNPKAGRKLDGKPLRNFEAGARPSECGSTDQAAIRLTDREPSSATSRGSRLGLARRSLGPLPRKPLLRFLASLAAPAIGAGRRPGVGAQDNGPREVLPAA
jgi:hypothetical protein